MKISLGPIVNPYFMANYDITIDNEKFILNPTDIASLDIVPIGNQQFHALRQNRSYKIKILNTDFANKTMTIEVNGNSYAMVLADEYDQMVHKMGLLTTKTHKINNIKAPMPGLIIDVMATVGQKVEAGTPLIVLSAMKMENIITSPGEGVIKSINVKVNDTVDKGQLIIEME
ncbi:acetyl-CoA carboxylase biotin carboxyl carrier protein subunit [Arenibacter echinorum]|nr:acetyl-CoA carboxylase biotin carboxyl carrier protein subunit [Arenibacter echinorum]